MRENHQHLTAKTVASIRSCIEELRRGVSKYEVLRLMLWQENVHPQAFGVTWHTLRYLGRHAEKQQVEAYLEDPTKSDRVVENALRRANLHLSRAGLEPLRLGYNEHGNLSYVA